VEKANREEMKEEAIRRMKALKIHKNVINNLKNEGVLNRSEGKLGILFWLNKEEENLVKKFETKYNVFVYHVIKTYTVDMGCIYDLLYITEEKDIWKEEIERLRYGYVLSYTISQFSESGDILIKSRNGGLVRIG